MVRPEEVFNGSPGTDVFIITSAIKYCKNSLTVSLLPK